MMISNITSDIYGTLSQVYSNSLFLPTFLLVEDHNNFLPVTFFAWLLCCEKHRTHVQKKTNNKTMSSSCIKYFITITATMLLEKQVRAYQ